MIGIICAMEEEISGIRESFISIDKEKVSLIEFIKGRYAGKECVLALSGVGKVYAAMCTQTMILKYNPSCIINVGMAGGIGDKVNIKDTVIAKNVIQYDYDISMFGDKKKGQISGFNQCEIPCNDKIIKIMQQSLKELDIKSHLGNILTGDSFLSDHIKAEILGKEFNGLACEMECASIGQVCLINKVEFGALKVISDKADSVAVDDFEKFHVEYPQIINKIVEKIISKL